MSEVTVLGQGGICRLRLCFKSLVKFGSLVGLCAGIGTIPIYFILVIVMPRLIENAESFSAHDVPFLLLFVLVGAPLIGLLDGALFAILAFPLYRLLTNSTQVNLNF